MCSRGYHVAQVREKIIKEHIPDKQFKFDHVCRKRIPCSACRDYFACRHPQMGSLQDNIS